MKEKTCKSVRLGYGIIFSVYTAVVGALFIWQALTVYNTPPPEGVSAAFRPFTREGVIAALSKIDLFFWLWIAAVIVGFVLWEVFPVKEKPRKVSPDLQYARLVKRLPATAGEGLEEEYAAVANARKIIFALKVSAWALFGIAAVYGIVYLCIPANFPKADVTREVINMAAHIFPCIFAGLLVICGAGIYEKFAIKRILPSVKKLARGGKPAQNNGKLAAVTAVMQNKWVLLGVRIALAVIAVAFIVWGALNGNARAVFVKAINICTECIGLG